MYSAETAALNAILGIFSTIWLLVLAFFVINIVANWKIFTKANQPGWASIVPFYKSYIAFKIYWGNGWLFLVPLVLGLLGFIPLLGTLLVIAGVVINVITQYKKAVAFGQGIGFTIGLVLVSPIFNMILGLGNYQYLGIPQDGYSNHLYSALSGTSAGSQYALPEPQCAASAACKSSAYLSGSCAGNCHAAVPAAL